jgi:hypothetical protein
MAGRNETTIKEPTNLLHGVDAVWAGYEQVIVRMQDGSFRSFGSNEYG